MTIKCTACGSENGDGALFCADCGAGMPVRCAQCGRELTVGIKFCGSCGAAVAVSDSVQTPEPPNETERQMRPPVPQQNPPVPPQTPQNSYAKHSYGRGVQPASRKINVPQAVGGLDTKKAALIAVCIGIILGGGYWMYRNDVPSGLAKSFSSLVKLRRTTDNIGYITRDNVFFRKNIEDESGSTLNAYTEVKILGLYEDGGRSWQKVKFDGKKGWVPTEFVVLNRGDIDKFNELAELRAREEARRIEEQERVEAKLKEDEQKVLEAQKKKELEDERKKTEALKKKKSHDDKIKQTTAQQPRKKAVKTSAYNKASGSDQDGESIRREALRQHEIEEAGKSQAGRETMSDYRNRQTELLKQQQENIRSKTRKRVDVYVY